MKDTNVFHAFNDIQPPQVSARPVIICLLDLDPPNSALRSMLLLLARVSVTVEFQLVVFLNLVSW